MRKPLQSTLTFFFGVICTLVVVVLLGAEGPGEQRQQVSTQIIPVMGGMGLLLSVTDHAEQHVYIFELPTKNDETVKLFGSIDLSATSQGTLPAELNFPGR